MNVQTLKAKMTKGSNMTKSVTIKVDNREYEILDVVVSMDRVELLTEKKEEVVPPGDSLENQTERRVAEEEEVDTVLEEEVVETEESDDEDED